MKSESTQAEMCPLDGFYFPIGTTITRAYGWRRGPCIRGDSLHLDHISKGF